MHVFNPFNQDVAKLIGIYLAVWHLVFDKKFQEWRVQCKPCRADNLRVDNARRHANSSRHTAKMEAHKRLSSHPAKVPDPAIPIETTADLFSTRFLAYLSSDPEATLRSLPPMDSFPDSSAPMYETMQTYNWDGLDQLDPQFVGSREAEEMQALSDYMLGVYQRGPDNINSDDDHSNAPTDTSDSDMEYDIPTFEESRGTVENVYSLCQLY